MIQTTPGIAATNNRAPYDHTIAAFIEKKLNEAAKPNKLINEKSPYLLQHAFNPVDWYPWGEEAFAKARELNRPIFLSIGYSTCHWCHVMAHESFENEAIAALLNTYFICIKIDREERPDIDKIYMSAAQALTGQGGWPLSVFLTPDLKPFYAGTYFPPESKYGRPGFPDILESVHTAWNEKRDQILVSADRITGSIRSNALLAEGEENLGEGILAKGAEQFAEMFDEKYAGFGNEPKFPRPIVYSFLFRHYHRTGDKKSLDMALRTLESMANGGLHDHLGGGFHRYSTDREWQVPHFEKMLYDQAQLAISYLEAYQITGEKNHAQTARDTLDYVLRNLSSPEGGFYSAEDADSPTPEDPTKKSEGAFYLWHMKEIDSLLDGKTAALFKFRYNIIPAGNIFYDPHGEFGDNNIIHIHKSLEETAAKFKISVEDAEKSLEEAKLILLKKRNKRPRSHLDDKVITSWNGLMISGFAHGGTILSEKRYLEAAKKAADFLLSTLRDPITNTLLRRYRDGNAGLEAHLDDYAFLVQGLLDLYEASLDMKWLQSAMDLTKRQIELFWDAENGGFFDTSTTDSNRILRLKSDYEGAKPSGNSVAALNLLRMAEMLDKDDWRDMGRNTVNSMGRLLKRSPGGLPQLLVAHNFTLTKPRQIIIAGDFEEPATKAMLHEVYSRFLPQSILLHTDGGEGQKKLAEYLPFIKNIKQIDGKPTAYVCQDYTCSLPVTAPEDLAKMLE